MLCVIAKLNDPATEKLIEIREAAFPADIKAKPLYGHITLATYLGDDESGFIRSCRQLLTDIADFSIVYEKAEVLDETSIIVATPAKSEMLTFLHQCITRVYNDSLDQWTKAGRWYPHTTLLFGPGRPDLHSICSKMNGFFPFAAAVSRIEFSRVCDNHYEIIDSINLFHPVRHGRNDHKGDYMEKLYYEIPDESRKDDAIEYIREFYEYQSDINGSGGLDRFLDDYAGWLEKLERDYTQVPTEERVPARTFFLVRETDRRIVGMINIRLALNERLSHFGGHMGYSIRPSERGKGYNKINLYLGLKVCNAHGIKEVFMDADLNNPASWKTMEALGGVRIREYYDDVYAHCTVVDYIIDVKKALEEHPEYEEMICSNS